MTCPPGSEFDKLVKACIPKAERTFLLVTESPPVLWASSKAPSQHATEVRPFVWVSVVVMVSGSILALFLWFIVYRRLNQHSRAADVQAEASPGLETAGGTDSMKFEGEGPPTSCPHLNGRPHGLLNQDVPTWGDVSECDAGGRGGMHVCNGRKDHGIPLPATELGDTALVTAKTVQYPV
ncbi:hypothetical protein GJAV_G00223200 [Gymnothorax javanicus]|nr:hypothetical protein GJAV_G00223200 [Gymnothorax javanicus]